jgi:hypothetical protein
MPTATSKKIASALVALRRGGSGTFAAVLIGVGAGWYCRNSPKPQHQAELASMSDVANDTERRQAPSLLPFAFLVAYATTVAFFSRLRGIIWRWARC